MANATFEYDGQLNLKPEQLATLFTKLAEMQAAALPCAEIVSALLRTEAKLRKPLSLMLRRVNAGCAISEAGFRSGIFNEAQKTLLRAAESSGQLAEVYGQFAAYYTGLASRTKKVKFRMFLLSLFLSVALFLMFWLTITSNELSVGQHKWVALFGAWAWLWIKGVKSAFNRMLLAIPLTRNWIVQRELTGFFFILGMMLKGDVAFDEALSKAVACIKNPIIRKKFDTALKRQGEGNSVAGVLSAVPVISAAQLQMLNRSEQSDRLASGILDYVNVEAQYMSQQNDALAGRLSLLIYSLVGVWMAYFVLTGRFAMIVQIL